MNYDAEGDADEGNAGEGEDSDFEDDLFGAPSPGEVPPLNP